jgi:hypothetical protein
VGVMTDNSANRSKAEWVFREVFDGLGWDWAGPEFDFDSDSFKARVQSGPLKGRIKVISCERLEDRNVSALHLKNELLRDLNETETQKT